LAGFSLAASAPTTKQTSSFHLRFHPNLSRLPPLAAIIIVTAASSPSFIRSWISRIVNTFLSY
jgi:hypothetical protein